MNKAYVYRLYPDREQEVMLHKTFGCVRFVFNRMLASRKLIYEQYNDDKDALKGQKYPLPADFKKEYPWLREVDSLALANAQLHFNAACRNFFRSHSTGFPRFKSKHRDRKSYTTNNQKGTIRLIDESTIRLPKLKNVKIKLHRPLPSDSEIKSATISQSPSGKYYIAILLTYEKTIEPVTATADTTLGLDYSSSSLYIDSQGTSAEYPRYYRQQEQHLRRAQRTLSRRKRGGRNRDKQRKKVAKLHEKVANQRKDFLHKLSRQIANAYSAVAIEDLHMRGMAQALRLGKSTTDNGFGMFRAFLAYKLAEQGKHLVIIDKWYPSSRLCRFCGTIHQGLTLNDREWKCPECHTLISRDVNAAINIKHEGCRLLQIA